MSNYRFGNSFRKWCFTVDSMLFILITCIAIIGAILITTASPAVAERLHIHSFYFVHRQFFYLALSLLIIIYISSIDERLLRQIVLLGFTGCLFLMILLLFVGEEVKGSKRWISFLGVSLQPSELMKPFYIFILALLLEEKYSKQNFPGFTICILVYGILSILLIMQPDFGMVITYSAVLAGQFFLGGLALWWIFVVIVLGVIGAFTAYKFLPHVARRIDSFLNPEVTENYQVEKSLEAYVNGSILGKGPGEGTVKAHLPDSHTDFIFAVAGEEFGAIFSSLIIILYLAIIIRGTVLLFREQNLLKIYAGGGVLILFALQTIFNIGVTLHLFPTKGMTLPFISYGGSSMLCFAISFGIFLNLTKKRYEIKLPKNPSMHLKYSKNVKI